MPPGDATESPESLVHERLLAEHETLFDAVSACADAVASRWDGDATTDRDAVVPPLHEALRQHGVLDHVPTMLATGADALGVRLPAAPVAAPPYLVVTATGPVVRATLPEVGRLVVSVEVFTVDRSGDAPTYRRTEGDAGEILTVELR